MIFDNLFSTRSLENPAVPLSSESAYEDLFGAQTTKAVSPDLAGGLCLCVRTIKLASSTAIAR